jgi:hypothetical protein
MMTPLEAWTMAYEGIKKQGGFAYEAESCKYRTSDGKKCAAGHLITDKVYKKEFEYQTIDKLIHYGDVSFDNPPLIYTMQQIHDHCARRGATMEEWERQMLDLKESLDDYV